MSNNIQSNRAPVNNDLESVGSNGAPGGVQPEPLDLNKTPEGFAEWIDGNYASPAASAAPALPKPGPFRTEKGKDPVEVAAAASEEAEVVATAGKKRKVSGDEGCSKWNKRFTKDDVKSEDSERKTVTATGVLRRSSRLRKPNPRYQ